jgi:hypothetical protein
VLRARSSLECRTYIELHPCACRDATVPPSAGVHATDAGLVARYEGRCPRCGAPRRFELALDDEIVPADAFGGARPSSLLDAGQFLAIADAHAKRIPPTVHDLDRAIAALIEVLKLIPDGADAVPPDSLTSPEGRALYDRELGGRFRRARLEAELRVLRAMRAQL